MNDTINPGDVFLGKDPALASFSRIEVLSRRTTGTGGWLCVKTDWKGKSHNSWTHDETLLGTRYTREVKQDFNRNTESYPRPMDGVFPKVDLPDSATALIRDTYSVPLFIGKNSTTLIHVGQLGVLRQAKSKKAKAQLLLSATDGYMMLAVPGTYSMDVFYVDNRDDALKALGFTTVEQKETFTDASGKVWVAA